MGYYKAYNTKQLRSLIKSKNFSNQSISNRVSELVGTITPKSVENVLYGYVKMSDDIQTALALVLGVSENHIASLVSKKANVTKKKPNTTAKKTAAETKPASAKSPFLKINTKNLKKILNDDERSFDKIEKQAGLSSGTLYRWLRPQASGKIASITNLAKILNVSIKELVVDDTVKPVETTKPIAIKKEDTSVKLKSVDGILNVFEAYKIINDNLQTVVDTVNKANAETNKQLTDLIKASSSVISAAITSLDERVKALETTVTSDTKKSTERVLAPTPKVVIATNINKLTYNPKDDYNTFKLKVNQMVTRISNITNLTKNQVKHDYYETLNKTYGAVWAQMKKDFKNKYGRVEESTLELIHDDTTFASIYFNLLKGGCTTNS